MQKYKLLITIDFEAEDEAAALAMAKETLLNSGIDNQSQYNSQVSVAVTRDGDRSAANLMAPVGGNHYRHHKIALSHYWETEAQKV